MRFGKYRSDEKILHDEYFGEQPSTALLLAARLFLLCLMSSSFVMIFCDIYGYSGIIIPASVAAAASGLIYILASLLPPALVYGSVIAASAGVVWLLRDRVVKLAGYFWDYMCKHLDSRLLHTSGFMLHREPVTRAAAGMQENLMQTAFFWAAIALAVLASVLFTYAVRTRFRLTVPVIAVTVITAPAVAAETAGFVPSFLIFAVCLFGFEAIASSYELDNGFVYGSSGSARLSLARSDREYARRAAKLPFGKRAQQDTMRYHRYTGNMIAAAVLSAAAFFGASALIPDGKGISYQKVFDLLTSAYNTAADAVGGLIGIPLGRPDDRGYFSSGNYGDVSGSISIQPPGDSDRPVLEVTLTRGDIPVYLRGDIGVEYGNDTWSSVSTVASRYEEAMGEGFYPETEYQMFRRYISAAYDFSPDEVMPLQMVNVKYLRSTRVVFSPVAAYELDYRDSGYYSCYGDYILRTREGYVKSFESLALTPDLAGGSFGGSVVRTGEQLADEARSGVDAAVRSGVITAPESVSGDYLSDISAYREFVRREYSGSSPVIRRFVDISGLSDMTVSGLTAYSKAQYICDYFSNAYHYSMHQSGEGDMLEEFLYGSKEGHCALYATAMTLAMRELGYPARYVTGYVIYPGMQEPGSDGLYHYTLTERMLHAWTEVYFEGIGWLPFDPTAEVPGYAAQTALPQETAVTSETSAPVVTSAPEASSAPEVTTAPDETAQSDDDTTAAPSGTSDTADPEAPVQSGGSDLWLRLMPIIVIMAVILALAIVVLLVARSVNAAEARTVAGFRTMPTNEAVRVMYRFIITLLGRKGLTPGSEQLYDFTERVDGSIELKGMNAFMMDVITVIEKAEFGRDEDSPVTEDEREAVYRYAAAVYSKLMSDVSPFKRFFMKISLFL